MPFGLPPRKRARRHGEPPDTAKETSVVPPGLPVEGSSSSSRMRCLQKNRLGMQLLWEPEDTSTAVADVVFIHGLTGNSYDTWLHKESQTHWPISLLSQDFPDVRILSFGYVADVVHFWAPANQNTVAMHAKNLLSQLADLRDETDCEDRPIIVVAHSLGGLVTANALTLSRASSLEDRKMVGYHINAIIFLGTPHCGSDLAVWGSLGLSMAKVVKQANIPIIDVLRRDSEVLAAIQGDFSHALESRKNEGRRILITCFVETLPVSGVGRIVPAHSAILPGNDDRSIEANHMDMVRFANREDPGYRSIVGSIRRGIKAARIAVRRDEGASQSDPTAKEGPRGSRFGGMDGPGTAGDTTSHETPSATEDDADRRCLEALRLYDPREHKTRIQRRKGKVLQGSCSWVVENTAFLEWLNSSGSSLLWIHGDPGKGKTMIMIALIEEIQQRLDQLGGHGLLSYVFCENDLRDSNNALAVLRGLVYQLVDQRPILLRHLRKRYEAAKGRLFEERNALHVMLDVLSDIIRDRNAPPVYLLVDALDECDSDIEIILEWIRENESILPPKMHWLTTSRNEGSLMELGCDGRLHTSLEINAEHVSHAVHRFIKVKVDQLAQRKRYDPELQRLVTEYLTDHADGTFLWVALVCEVLGDRKTMASATRALLEKQWFPQGLPQLYGRMQDRIQQLTNEDDAQDCVRILRSMTIASRPLHLEELGFLADLSHQRPEDLPRRVQDLVEYSGSFLTIREDFISFVHLSAKDYFTWGEGRAVFPIDESHDHRDASRRCLALISIHLRRNVAGLKAPDASPDEVKPAELEKSIPRPVRYACLHWMTHLELGSHGGMVDEARVDSFLRHKLLNWLEALSLLRDMTASILIISALETLLQQTIPTLHPLAYDAKRFIMMNRRIIEVAPLQAYSSAVEFTPKQSLIRGCYLNERPRWIERYPIAEGGWTPCLRTLEGHTSAVTATVFSNDGRLLASASCDETVRLWGPATGVLQSTLEGHTDVVSAVAFSNDGRLLASASLDKTVRLWDPATGVLQSTLEGHTQRVSAVAFSNDGRLLASASWDKTVRLWDPATGVLQSTLEGHTQGVNAVAFSNDGRLLASASWGKTVRLWGPATGVLQSTLEGHTDVVSAVAFSNDGRLLASASLDKTVRLWDPATGVLQSTLEGHTQRVSAVAFSNDGRLLASASWDKTVRLWDPATGVLQSTLEGHTQGVNAVAFSNDGRLLASASWDETVRLRDPATGVLQSTLEGHTQRVSAVAFSNDGRLLASASWDGTVRLWDPATGVLQSTLEGHTQRVSAVAFSNDGRLLASASWDKTVRLWDTNDTCVCQIYETGWIDSLSFTEDNLHIMTERGCLGISPSMDLSNTGSFSTLSPWMIIGDWLTWQNRKLLWLPAEIRSFSRSAFSGNQIALGYHSGAVVFFKFDWDFSGDGLV